MSRRFSVVSYYYFLGFRSFISGINHCGFIFRCKYIRMVWCAKMCLENWCAHMQKSGSKTVEDDQLIKSSSSRYTKEAGERKKSHIDSIEGHTWAIHLNDTANTLVLLCVRVRRNKQAIWHAHVAFCLFINNILLVFIWSECVGVCRLSSTPNIDYSIGLIVIIKFQVSSKSNARSHHQFSPGIAKSKRQCQKEKRKTEKSCGKENVRIHNRI